MSFQPRPGQEPVLEARDPVVVVLGGAGTGKTTLAAAVVRDALDKAASARKGPKRALFLSFSRAAVAQIIDRTEDVLGRQAERVEITTFHAFAWKLLKRWGAAIGMPEPTLVSPSEAQLFGAASGVTYRDLLPLALRLAQIPCVQRHLRSRWAIVVSDEFQDTSDEQFELIKLVSGSARLLFLGDLNQCIYSNLPGATGVGPERIAAALNLPGARRIDLPKVSHRDPTNTLPAAAGAIRERDFHHEAVGAAISSGMLNVQHYETGPTEGVLVSNVIRELKRKGHTSVGVFSHHVDATASLSDELTGQGVTHEIVGLPDSVTSAVQTQFEMLCHSANGCGAETVRRALAVFVTSAERGQRPPQLARMIARQVEAPHRLEERLNNLETRLEDSSGVTEALRAAANALDSVGLSRGQRAWARGTAVLRAVMGPRLCREAGFPADGFELVRRKLAGEKAALLTLDDAGEAADVQLMGLYQAKGREADATVVVFRENDFYGSEGEPMPEGSKLLYVVLSRARKRTIILTLGSELPGLVAPLAALSRPAQ